MDVVQLPVDELLFDPQNARKHSDANVTAVKRSLTEFGQQKPIVVTSENIVAAGNCTLVAAAELGWKTIDAVRTDLEGDEVAAYAIADNRTAELAEWNTDVLEKQLASLSNEMKTDFQFDQKSLDEILNEQATEEKENYSRKIEPPIYEVTGDCPAIEELYDTEKSDELKAAINLSLEAGHIQEDEAEFLTQAADRHTQFSFSRIAEFYAHSPSEVQQLMEDSALVTIDFDAAVENGFVQLSKQLMELAGESKDA